MCQPGRSGSGARLGVCAKMGLLVAIVDNELLRSPWKVGHEIVVLHEHVLETSDPMYLVN